jgi:hypothetical protein
MNQLPRKSESYLYVGAHYLVQTPALSCVLGLYRLCGSATKKRILREAFERNARTVDLSPDNVPDINVITGKECAET